MSEAPRSQPRDAPPVLRKFRPLIILAAAALIFACLRVAREVLIPIAIATLLAFVLTPLVAALQRRGVHRVLAAVVVVVLVSSVLGVAVWGLAQQVNTLANDLPRYRHNIRQKVADVRVFGRGGSLEKVQEAVRDVVGEMQKDDTPSPAPRREPVPVVPAETALWQLPSTIGAIAGTAITVVLVIALVAFMLVERQELRNRLIRLFGRGRITLTTKALDEAAHGVIRYLLMYSLVNACFGTAVMAGLWLLGVPYPVLWGTLAALLRFIPYVGTWMAALLPITMSLAVFPGWVKPLMVVALFAVLEPFIYAIVEPSLYGRSIGISPTALVVAVALWTWLWGPMGLILAVPLTVCLTVVGKYVPELEFLFTLVSDKPVLAPDLVYYQRLIALDHDEAAEIVETQLEALGTPAVYDEVMLPALSYARRDRAYGRLTDEEAAFVTRTSREIFEATIAHPPITSARSARARILGCSARDEADEIALRMLGDVLAPSGVIVETASAELLTAELVSAVEQAQPSCICVATLPPGGLTHTRYLLKRLRGRFPDACIVAGRWGGKGELDEDLAPLLAAGADRVGTTLAATRDHLLELLPLTAATPSTRARTA